MIDDRSIGEAKRLGLPKVTIGVLAFCIARALEQRGVDDLPATSNSIAEGLPGGSSDIVKPTIPDELRPLLDRVVDADSALDLLSEILDMQWEARGPSLGTTETVEDLLAELDSLVGLGSVKEEIRELVAVQRVTALREEEGLPEVEVGLHLVFTGEPGTGKTTVARLVARIYKALGLLSRGHLIEVGRGDLVAGYVGQTAIAVKAAFSRAQGGVLFVDEAYALTPQSANDFGGEAISTIVMEMENRRDDLAVIVAGYERPMQQLLEANEGLRSRFQTVIRFTNYDPDELLRIWSVLADRAQIYAPPSVRDAILDHFEHTETSGQMGNGRYARRLFEEMYRRLATRAAADDAVDLDEISSFALQDVPEVDGPRTLPGLYL